NDDLAANAKNVGLFLLGVAYQRFADKIEEQQEVVAGISDVLIRTYAMESATLRARKIGRANATAMAEVFASEAMDAIETSARTVLAACSDGDDLRANLAVLRRLTKRDTPNTVALRRQIAENLLQANRYVV